MAKSLVEKYEQILSQDPASTVFVELAKALIEKGDNPRAIEVCAGGLEHHPDSVVGRVLWGKALINQGRPAEAMEQFDKAIAINRDNPHAYNLIGEVLLHKGLYRSALPGIVTGILLALARISGETAPLLFTALNNQYWTADLTSPMASVPVVIFQYAMSPYESWHALAWAGAFVVTVFVLLLSVVSRAILLRNKVPND